MIHVLEDALIEVFWDQAGDDAVAISALNVAMARLLHAPYFGNSYANHTLRQRGEKAFGLVCTHAGDTKDVDVLRHVYDEGWDDEPAEPYIHRLPSDIGYSEHDVPTLAKHIPDEIWAASTQWLERVAAHNSLARTVLHPSSVDLHNRNELVIDVLDEDTLGTWCATNLGPSYDPSLKRFGISYHHPVHSWNRQEWMFVVAHNGHEVAGVLGASVHQHEMGLAYVSVGPGFRRQGLSNRLYQEMINRCVRDNKIILRSRPSAFTQERPAITAHYDRLLHTHMVLHAHSGSRLQQVLLQAAEHMPFAQLLAVAKPHCDAVLAKKHDALDAFDHEDDWQAAQSLQEALLQDTQKHPQPNCEANVSAPNTPTHSAPEQINTPVFRSPLARP